jgi:hypothetical protein
MTLPQTVQRVITGTGSKRLVRFTLDTDRPIGDSTGSFYRDRQPPLWDADRRAWVEAGQVHPGDRLRSADGKFRSVVATRAWAETRTVHNLTVANTRTFYVKAGGATVHVHNDGGFDWGKGPEDLRG